jgi:predicted CoA-substrate-specific enzyme activase
MLYAGIDIGSLTAEAVVVENGTILAAASMSVRPNPIDSAKEVLAQALESGGLTQDRLSYTVSTGYGREKIQAEGMAQKNVSEISCHGYGAFCQAPGVKTIVDIGGQDAKVIRVNGNGELDDFVMNDKCAAGTGHFLEIMCKALGIGLDEIGPLSFGAKKPVHISSRCSIYAETEVLHFLQRGVAKADVAAGINKAMADRVFALVRRVGLAPEAMMTGGVAKNVAVRAELEKLMKVKMKYPKIDPQLIGAYGAAMLAQREGGSK